MSSFIRKAKVIRSVYCRVSGLPSLVSCLLSLSVSLPCFHPAAPFPSRLLSGSVRERRWAAPPSPPARPPGVVRRFTCTFVCGQRWLTPRWSELAGAGWPGSEERPAPALGAVRTGSDGGRGLAVCAVLCQRCTADWPAGFRWCA